MDNTLKAPPLSRSLILWSSFLLLTLSWGSSFILMKRGMEAYSPWQVATIRLVSAFIVLSGLAIFHIRHIPRKKLPFVFLSGMLSMFIPSYLFCAAQVGLSSSIAGVLNALTPAFTFMIGLSFFHQNTRKMQVVGLLVGLLGSVLLILVNAKGEVSLNAYAFFVIIATISYGININLVKTHLSTINPLHLTTVAVSLSGLLALIYLMTMDGAAFFQIAQQNTSALLASITLGVVGTALAQLVFNKMIKASSAVFASSVTYFIPIVAVLWGVWDGEILSFWHYVGIGGIIGGILILNKYK